MVYAVTGDRCSIVWPNNCAGSHYHTREVVVVGRRPEIRIGDLVERGGFVGG